MYICEYYYCNNLESIHADVSILLWCSLNCLYVKWRSTPPVTVDWSGNCCLLCNSTGEKLDIGSPSWRSASRKWRLSSKCKGWGVLERFAGVARGLERGGGFSRDRLTRRIEVLRSAFKSGTSTKTSSFFVAVDIETLSYLHR